MDEGEPYKRRWRVTFARLGIALVVMAVASAVFYAGSHAMEVQYQDPRPHPFGASVAIVAAGGVLWLFPWGVIADHWLGELHPSVAFGVHFIGVNAAHAFSILPLMGLYMFNGPPMAEPVATLGLWTPSVGVVVAFLAAWLVPGSFATRAQRRAVEPDPAGRRVGPAF